MDVATMVDAVRAAIRPNTKAFYFDSDGSTGGK